MGRAPLRVLTRRTLPFYCTLTSRTNGATTVFAVEPVLPTVLVCQTPTVIAEQKKGLYVLKMDVGTLIDSVTGEEDKIEFMEQYVHAVTDFSSQYGIDGSISYTAYNLPGKPSKYPDYGDFPQAFVMVRFPFLNVFNIFRLYSAKNFQAIPAFYFFFLLNSSRLRLFTFC